MIYLRRLWKRSCIWTVNDNWLEENIENYWEDLLYEYWIVIHARNISGTMTLISSCWLLSERSMEDPRSFRFAFSTTSFQFKDKVEVFWDKSITVLLVNLNLLVLSIFSMLRCCWIFYRLRNIATYIELDEQQLEFVCWNVFDAVSVEPSEQIRIPKYPEGR